MWKTLVLSLVVLKSEKNAHKRADIEIHSGFGSKKGIKSIVKLQF